MQPVRYVEELIHIKELVHAEEEFAQLNCTQTMDALYVRII
jgi:hypothetical protein